MAVTATITTNGRVYQRRLLKRSTRVASTGCSSEAGCIHRSTGLRIPGTDRLHNPDVRSAVGPALRPRGGPLARLAFLVTILGLAGLLPRWPGILHEVALPPLDLFADIRVLMVQANSYPLLPSFGVPLTEI